MPSPLQLAYRFDRVCHIRDAVSTADERARIERHLVDCAECRQTAADFRALLDELAATTPVPPDVGWARYRAELRGRLAARRARSWRARWLRPLPAAAVEFAYGSVVPATM